MDNELGNITLPYGLNLRDYQKPVWEYMVPPQEGLRAITVWPRRNGKDLVALNITVAKAIQEVGLYFYIAPYYNQVRQIIWEGFDKSGRRFLDYIPKQLIKRQTQVDMRTELWNGSQIKLCGSDNIDSIVGTNPRGVVFTEFSLHKPQAWEYIRPILAENGGWALFNGTPRGLNHFFKLYQDANKNPKWFVQYLNRDLTGIPSLEAIEEDRNSGMPEALVQQEYYCSFTSGVLGSYYADQLAKLRDEQHVQAVPWEPRLRVFTFWDLGVADATAIWFIQAVGREFRVIDYYEESGEGLPHYIKVLEQKPYVYEEHFAPHDIEVREYTSGTSRLETAQDLGIDFTVVPKTSIEDGIEAVRTVLPRCYFDSVKTEDGLNALTHYKKSFDEKRQVFGKKPVHDWSSNGADAFRMFAVSAEDIGGGGYSDIFGSQGWEPPKVVGRGFQMGRRAA